MDAGAGIQRPAQVVPAQVHHHHVRGHHHLRQAARRAGHAKWPRRRPTRSARPNSLKIADVCDHVPAEPPRDFWEAVQSVRFMHLAAWKESSGPGRSAGRQDRPVLVSVLQGGHRERQAHPGSRPRNSSGAMWLKIREVENLVTIKREHRAAPGQPAAQRHPLRPRQGRRGPHQRTLLDRPRSHGADPSVASRRSTSATTRTWTRTSSSTRSSATANSVAATPRSSTTSWARERYLDRERADRGRLQLERQRLPGLPPGVLRAHGRGRSTWCRRRSWRSPCTTASTPAPASRWARTRATPGASPPSTQLYEAFLKQEDYFADKMREHYFIWWTTEIANSPMSGLRAGMLYRDCIPAGLASREGGCRYPEGKASWVGDKGISDCATTWPASSTWSSTRRRSPWPSCSRPWTPTGRVTRTSASSA